MDAGRSDGGAADARVADGGSDAGPADVGPPDAGPADAGPPDAGPPDVGPPDTGPPDAGPRGLGDRCAVAEDCASGFCADGRCCDGACTGGCESCGLPLTPGRCSPHPVGTDPEAACGAVSCSAHFSGFDASGACHARQDAGDDDAACDGAGACAATAEVCAARPAAIASTIDCDDTCQAPSPGTCTGTIAGTCDDVDLGTSTCGIGACERTVPRCAAGAPMACMAGTAITEICANAIDDDCDGAADELVTADDFDGTALAMHWSPAAVGMAPTFSVAGGRLTITDAAFAPTPSMPANSWIYDLDVDRGNQMHWLHPIGTGDFELLTDFSFSSTVPQLTLGFVALVSAGGQIEILASFGDGSELGLGAVAAVIRRPGPDAGAGAPTGVSGMASFRIVRSVGNVRIERDGVLAVEAPNAADIIGVAIVAVRHYDARTSYEFGTFEVDRIALCY
jgi:hypothetical protein